jgi:hypothetical protein
MVILALPFGLSYIENTLILKPLSKKNNKFIRLSEELLVLKKNLTISL